MSSENTVTFHCPSCNQHLSVPVELVGVTGPCPSCETLIQAPPQAVQNTDPAPPPKVAPEPQEQAGLEYTPPKKNLESHPEVEKNPQIAQDPAKEPAPQKDRERERPQYLPSRSRQIHPPRRVRSELIRKTRPEAAPLPPVPRQNRKKKIRPLFPAFLIGLLLIGLLLGGFYGMKKIPLNLLSKQATEISNPTIQKEIKPILAEEKTTIPDDLTSEESPPTNTEDDPSITEDDQSTTEDDQSTTEDGPSMPILVFPTVGFSQVDPGENAMKILEDFLAMKTLQERLPYLESQLEEDQLLNSVLNGALPTVAKITEDIRETNLVEQISDYYYYVDFLDESGNVKPHTMLVRTRGKNPPKVVADPFLDLFGGRFEKFASAPTDEIGKFQVIVTAGAFCYDDVPNPEEKFTLEILPRDNTEAIAKAYFTKTSEIGELLKDQTSGLSFGRAKACSLFFRWNLEEDPKNPFLEAVGIISLDWNP